MNFINSAYKFNVHIVFVIVLVSEFIFYAETKSNLQLKLENQKYSNYKEVILLHYVVAEMHHKIYDRFIQIAKHFTFNPKVNYFNLITNKYLHFLLRLEIKIIPEKNSKSY